MLGAFRLNSISMNRGLSFTPASDSFAQYLRLAIPFNQVTGLDDISHLISGSPNSVSSTRTGPDDLQYSNIQVEDSKFYGSSYRQYPNGGSTTKLAYALQQSWFPHTTNFTIEFWMKTTRTNFNSWFLSNVDVGGRMLVGFYIGTPTSTDIGLNDVRVIISEGWHHIAIQRDYWYFDGVRKGTVSQPTLTSAIANLHIGHQKPGDPNDWEGYLNDFRLYIGVNKYSGTSITPPGAIGTVS